MVINISIVDCITNIRVHNNQRLQKKIKSSAKSTKRQGQMSKSKMQMYQKIGQKKLNQKISSVSKAVSDDIKKLIDLFNIQDNLEEITEAFKKEPKLNTDNINLKTLEQDTEKQFQKIEKQYSDALSQDVKEGVALTEAQKKIKEKQRKEFKLIQALYANKNVINKIKDDILENSDKQVKMREKTQQEIAMKEAEFLRISQQNEELESRQERYIKQLGEVYKITANAENAKVINKVITGAIEGAFPAKFCWKVAAPKLVCNDANYEWHFTSCKLKCGKGYERFGFHCRKSCTTAEIHQEICKYQIMESRIVKRATKEDTWGSSDFRYLSEPESTYNPPLHEEFMIEGHSKICPKNFELETKAFGDSCKPTTFKDFTCISIGYKQCMVKGCTISSLDCKNFKLDAAIKLATSVMKITSMFIAPGTGQILGWIIKGLKYLQVIKNIIKSVIDKWTQFKNIYDNAILKKNLEEKMLATLKGNQFVVQNIDAISKSKNQKLDEKIQQQIKYNLALQYSTITKQDMKEDSDDMDDYKTKNLSVSDKEKIITDSLKLAGVAANEITTAILKEETKEFFGDGVKLTDTSSLSLGNLFNLQTFLNVHDTAITCSKSAKGAGCLKGMLGVGANFDPTGILHLIQVFVQPFCNIGSALNAAGKPINPDQVENEGLLTLKFQSFSSLGGDKYIFVKHKNSQVIYYYQDKAQPENLIGIIDSDRITEIEIQDNYENKEGNALIKIKLQEPVDRNDLQLIAKKKNNGASKWIEWFKAKQLALCQLKK